MKEIHFPEETRIARCCFSLFDLDLNDVKKQWNSSSVICSELWKVALVDEKQKREFLRFVLGDFLEMEKKERDEKH